MASENRDLRSKQRHCDCHIFQSVLQHVTYSRIRPLTGNTPVSTRRQRARRLPGVFLLKEAYKNAGFVPSGQRVASCQPLLLPADLTSESLSGASQAENSREGTAREADELLAQPHRQRCSWAENEDREN